MRNEQGGLNSALLQCLDDVFKIFLGGVAATHERRCLPDEF